MVTDGQERAALAVVRSLGGAGYRCVVASSRPRCLAAASRYADRVILVPDSSAAPDEFADALEALVREEAVDLVIPITEASIQALLPRRSRLSAVIPFARTDIFHTICDKTQVLQTANELGIAVPDQVEIRPGDQLPEATLPFPVVLKPARSVFTRPDGSRGNVGVRWARSLAELHEALTAYPEAAFPVLVQRVVTGPGVGVFVLMQQGKVFASFSHRRIREKPPTGGVSVLRQSQPLDPNLLERSVALLQRFGWSGVAMVEYKVDRETGEPFLMEINGRFWGSLQLAIDAGVDFPRLLAEAALGRPVAPQHDYRFVRSRWFWGDVDHILAVWRDPARRTTEKLRMTVAWLRAFGPGYRSEIFRWSDPLPFLRETRGWFTALGKTQHG